MQFLVFYSAYASVCTILYCFIYRRQDTHTAVMRLQISLLVVPLGLVYALWFYQAQQDASASLIVDENPMKPKRIHKEVEMRRIPMSEALSLNDHLVCCDLLMDALHDDPQKYIPSIRLALEAGDSETSHYAAAAIMDLQQRLMEGMRLSHDLYLQNPEDQMRLNNYADALRACIDSKLMDENMTGQLIVQYCDVLNLQLINNHSPDVYEKRIEYALAQKQYDVASSLCSQFLSLYPYEDAAYRIYMQCMIKMRNHEGMRIFLSRLSSAPVELNEVTLQYVRCLREVLLHAQMDIPSGSSFGNHGVDFL